MVLKLHGLSVSTNTARVVACLHEKDVDFELVPVDLFARGNKEPSFLAKNPFGQIPVLEDGGITLFESRAITSYVAEKFKETGTDLIRHESFDEAALVKVWTEVESQQYHPAICPIIYEFFGKPVQGLEPDQAVIDANLEKLEKVLNVYEAKLSSTKYLAGDFYSLADLHHFPYTFYFMKTTWGSVISDRPHVKAWWDDITSRPALKKVAEGMTFGENQ
ncbi:glutathione S-transferase F13-like [Rosa rugosa]|uniref:glutathione S-transferase F13-like n=1 Tax=Rosa rugosa TaxID=74645 RepID=UPI002B411538|nr:glutathione S-transferase F13-like [Rosa rugosa]